MYVTTSFSPCGNQQRGLSLVELLISMVIGMAVIAGSLQVVVSSKDSFVDQEEMVFIQTNARYALDLISKDIRMAGYMGCATQNSMQSANSIDNDEGGFISLHGLEGFEGGVNTNTFPTAIKSSATTGTDAILVRHASTSRELDVKSHNAASAVIHVWGQHDFAKGSTLMIADSTCRNVGIFQVSGPNSIPANHINHNTGSGTNNCTKIIKGDFVCTSSCKATSCGGYGKATGAYGPGSKIMEFSSHAYFIADSTVMPGIPALKRQVFNADGTPGTATEELALGVEDLEILYGVDSDSNGSIDSYLSATNMDLDSSGGISDDEWDQVLSVKISMVFRSNKPVLTTAESKTLAGVTYNDKYVRQLVNATVRIRNRG